MSTPDIVNVGLTVFFIVAMAVQAWWINPGRKRRRRKPDADD